MEVQPPPPGSVRPVMSEHRRDAVIRVAFHFGNSHHRTEERVFAERLLDPSPTQVAHHVDAGGQHLLDTHRIQLSGDMFGFLTGQLRIERASQGYILGENGGPSCTTPCSDSATGKAGMPNRVFPTG